MSTHAFVSLFPVPGAAIYMEASETFVPDRRLEAAGVYVDRLSGSKRNASLPVLHVIRLERFPDISSALRRLVASSGDPRCPGGAAGRLAVAVDVSHPTAGMIASRRVWEVSRTLPRTRLALVDSSVFDLPAPERSGWRWTVGRRSIVGALFEAVEEGRLKLEVPSGIRKEAAGQIASLTARPDKETDLEAEALARTIGLTVWIQSVIPRGA